MATDTMANKEQIKQENETKQKQSRDYNLMAAQQEALRKVTILKHRKVSTQLKLDMIQRQMLELKRNVPESEEERQFYRHQMKELHTELRDLGATLENVERNAFYAQRQILRRHGISNAILSNSQPVISSTSDYPSRISRENQKCHTLTSSPITRFKKKHILGELRAVASLSSLNTKTHSHEEEMATKDSKSWKGPLRFLGNLVDTRLRRRFWGSTKRTKSADTILDEPKPENQSHSEINKCENQIRTSGYSHVSVTYVSTSSSSESSDDETDVRWNDNEKLTKCDVNKGNVDKNNAVQVDPAIMAEIEEFEKMAAQYIKQHS